MRVISITDKLEQARRDDDTTIWGKLCIYRVPYYLQENDNKSYFPQTVSLGPYHHGTKSLFLNLIAFEQCHIDSRNDITSYIIFMDNLIDSPEDVSYLHYCGIIEHWLGSDSEVANLFNRLCEEVVFDTEDSYLSRLSVEVNRYYNQKWNA
ncbi:hypothetical protein Bca52824_000635 [Brassica carinata]|uniref:Uncharacterized protein n=1 Tax=Brassica carinata TaxID=52824 RepID=A0A8X8BBV7_BRACI|nr:hypothetical protein Bca52824_000635 [Brassica carinata]